MEYKKEKIWTRTGATRQEISATGVISSAEERSGKSVRWVQTSYTSNNASFRRRPL